MEAVEKRPPSEALKQFLATRRGAYALAGLCMLLAGMVLVVYLNRYKQSVNEGVAATPVLVADRLIPKGSAGSAVVDERLFRPTALAEQDLHAGAITDAALIRDKVATRDILPGQQITAADFAAAADPLRGQIERTQRAVQIPIGASNGLLGTVRPGDRVDVLVAWSGGSANGGEGKQMLQTLMRDVKLLATPLPGQPGGDVILELTDRDAAKMAFASDNGKLWFLLRPPTGAKDSRDDSPIDMDDLLANGGRPIGSSPAAAR